MPKTFHASTLAKWRSWLAKHHVEESEVLMIRHKAHTGKLTFSNSDAMDEAICFGWIDTTLHGIDEDRFGVRYVKRGKNSRWSHNTVARAKRLIAAGKMTPAGMRAYEDGLSRPLHERYPKDPAVPEELRRALAKSAKARAFFEGLAPSYRRIYILSVERMKRPETRERHALAVVERCERRLKPME